MFQVRALPLQIPVAALLAAALLAGCGPLGAPSTPGLRSPAARGEASPTAGVPAAPVAAGAPGLPSGSKSPSGSAPKAPATPPPASSGYPYPEDAAGRVVQGELRAALSAGGTTGAPTVVVTAPPGGWLAGQEIFLFLGTRYFATMAAPGATVAVRLPFGFSGRLAVSGFQFPGNSPAAPIDGYGTAVVEVGQ
jgi:hypothetical protein